MKEWPMGSPIILNLQKFFTDCFQNLPQRFIRIQEYGNDIVFKQEWPLAPPLGAPKVLKSEISSPISYKFGDKFPFEYKSLFIILKNM